MKRLQLLTFILMLSALSFGQNQSAGQVINPIFNPITQQFGGQEIFRFQPGLVTQLQSGSLFDFSSSQWFSIGTLNTALLPTPGNQRVFGLRFQLPRKALLFGYQDIGDINPRIQWNGLEPGSFLGDLEFRVADNFNNTNSKLVATMRNDGGTVFAENGLSNFDDAKVGILNTKFDKSLEILLELSSQNPTFGVDVFNNSSSPENYGFNSRVRGIAAIQSFGYSALVEGTSERNFGYFALVNGTAINNTGLRAIVSGNASVKFGVDALAQGEATINFGVKGIARDASTNFGIYGIVQTDSNGDSLNPGDFAGFFEGDVEVTGLFSSSDRKLKTDIVDIQNGFDDVMSLKPRMYEFIKTDKKVLPSGLQYGFIAQELEEVFPELIKEVKKPVFDKEGNITEFFEYKSVNYIGLIAILTASVQELSQEVERLKETNNAYVVYSDQLDAEELKKLEALAYKLEQNYPNPFQGKSVIEYSLPDFEKDASILVFDMTGKLLKEFKLREKSGQIEINSRDFEPGIYLYSLVSNNNEVITKKMIVK